MALKLNERRDPVAYSMLTTDTKPITGIGNGDTLEVLDATTKKVVSIWRWSVDDWYEY